MKTYRWDLLINVYGERVPLERPRWKRRSACGIGGEPRDGLASSHVGALRSHVAATAESW